MFKEARLFVRAFFFGAAFLFVSVASGQSDAIVIYFGGARSSKAVLDACFPNLRNYGYPVSAQAQAQLVSEIKANPARSYVLVGHSSGSTYAINVAKSAASVGRDNLTLVDLDGFAPTGIPSSVRTICWRAEGRSGLQSRNYASMSTAGCRVKKTVTASGCTSRWCLHFAIVNPAVRGPLGDWSQRGYDGCSEDSLEWLADVRASSASGERASNVRRGSTR